MLPCAANTARTLRRGPCSVVQPIASCCMLGMPWINRHYASTAVAFKPLLDRHPTAGSSKTLVIAVENARPPRTSNAQPAAALLTDCCALFTSSPNVHCPRSTARGCEKRCRGNWYARGAARALTSTRCRAASCRLRSAEDTRQPSRLTSSTLIPGDHTITCILPRQPEARLGHFHAVRPSCCCCCRCCERAGF